MQDTILALINRIENVREHYARLDSNIFMKKICRPALPPELRVTEKECLEAFGLKPGQKCKLTKTARKAMEITSHVENGKHNNAVIAEKAGKLAKLLREQHGLAHAKSVHADRGQRERVEAEQIADKSRDRDRLERLALETEERGLREECRALDEENWQLARRLKRQNEHASLPTTLGTMPAGELKKLRSELLRTKSELAYELTSLEEARRKAVEKLEPIRQECRDLREEIIRMNKSLKGDRKLRLPAMQNFFGTTDEKALSAHREKLRAAVLEASRRVLENGSAAKTLHKRTAVG